MKWLVRGISLFVTCSIYTLLQYAGLYSLGGIGAGLLSIALFGLGVWFIPSRIIKRLEAKKTPPPPSPPPAKKVPAHRENLYNFTVDGQSVCIPESHLESFQKARERIQAERKAAPPPDPAEPVPSIEQKPEPKRRPIPSYDKVGYQFAIFILSGLLFIAFINYASSNSQLQDVEASMEELEYEASRAYDNGYEAGRDFGYDEGAYAGYDAGYKEGYSDGYSVNLEEHVFFRTGACIVTTSGSKYHHWGCYHIDGSRYYIYNVELAESYGYDPCADCWEAGLLIDWDG